MKTFARDLFTKYTLQVSVVQPVPYEVDCNQFRYVLFSRTWREVDDENEIARMTAEDARLPAKGPHYDREKVFCEKRQRWLYYDYQCSEVTDKEATFTFQQGGFGTIDLPTFLTGSYKSKPAGIHVTINAILREGATI